jgi:microcystin degradation protein MlrC
MVRVAFCGISHETNTFATSALGLTGFDTGEGHGGFRPVRGDAVVQRTGGYTGGMVAAANELGYEPVGLYFAGTAPSGTIADECYIAMRDEIIGRLKDAMPVDVVAVDNHGAGVAESFECIEGDLATHIREVVGPSVPLIGTFDLHGNISDACAVHYDFMCPVHLYPHTDSFERGIEAMRMVPRLLAGLKTTLHIERVPTLLSLCMMCTQEGFPAAEMNSECEHCPCRLSIAPHCAWLTAHAVDDAEFMYSLEARDGVLDVTVFHGFPWADISIVGTTVVVTTDNDMDLAKSIGAEAGQWIWDHRHLFEVEISEDGVAKPETATDVHTSASAIEAALALNADGPVCELESPIVSLWMLFSHRFHE